MVNPTPSHPQIGTPYKRAGRLWSLGWHTGADLAPGAGGAPIVSATPGRVIAANAYDKSYGYKVIIRWGIYDVWYCHMPAGAANVRVGQTVKAGQRIGTVGATGNTTGPHLHMELRLAGSGFAAGNFRDPAIAINYSEDEPDTKTAGKKLAKPVTYVVATTALNGRGGPSTDHRIKGNPVARGKTVVAVRESGNWVMTATTRWFSKAYLRARVEPKVEPFSLRIGTFNIPDEGTVKDPKLPNAAPRIREAGKLLRSARLDVVGFQELVGRKGEGKPSAHAGALFTELGTGWAPLIPKGPRGAANENYGAYRTAKVELVKQFDDVILPSTFGNRHMTSALLRDKATGRTVLFVVTHLVNGKNAGAGRTAQGRVLEATSHEQAGGRPRVIVGDFNRSDRLPALVAAGMLDTRAASKTTTKLATYNPWSATVPSTDPNRVIDHIEVSGGAIVHGYSVLGIENGKFVPAFKPADHQLTITSVTFK